ncbi:hypothetical protein CPAV1605_297 [seawater metagenome]|uniref:Uncharacterized protein n=1 Tax=seawater metagenome TaxID=1561972 RepID=A0A5E8CLE2_9ZZZZ
MTITLNAPRLLTNQQLLNIRKNNIGISLQPLIGSYYEYINVNNDEYLRKSMIKYFREKTKKWLMHGDMDVVKCFSVSGKRVAKVACDTKARSDTDLEKIADYIYDTYVYPKRLVKKVLVKYTKLSGTNWYDLKINQETIRRLLNHVIKKEIKK